MPLVSEAQIEELVSVFYAQARAHAELCPLFNATIEDWGDHLRVIRDFWSHVLQGTGRDSRRAYQAHVGLGIRREYFDQWLGLFRDAAFTTLPTEAAQAAMRRAEHMTESFRGGLFPFDPVPPKH